MTTPTDAQLAELVELTEKTTPEPWRVDCNEALSYWVEAISVDGAVVTRVATLTPYLEARWNARFLVAAHEALPATITALQEARVVVRELAGYRHQRHANKDFSVCPNHDCVNARAALGEG